MSADLFDSVLGLIEQATGNNNNSWGTTFNNSMTTPVAQAIAGVNPIATTGGTTDLSTIVPPVGKRLDLHHIQQLTGTLTSDATVIVPNVSKTWKWWNNTTGAFNVFVKVPGGVARTSISAPGGLVQIPQGCIIEVVCDGAGNLMRMDDALIGQFSVTGKASAGPGELACNGASLLIAEYPDLYGKIAKTWGSVDSVHFTLPLLTDTNRYLRAGGGAGPAVGTYQANQNLAHTHTITGAPGLGTLATDTQGAHSHTATVNDSGHAHTTQCVIPGGGSSFFSASGAASSVVQPWPNTGSSATGISVSLTTNGAHAHNVTGAPSVGSLATASSGGSGEARPESAAALICIRY